MVVKAAAVVVSTLSFGACSLDGLLKSDDLPSTVTDPAITESPAGARAAYRGTLAGFQQAFGGGDDIRAVGSHILVTGLLSDELAASAFHTTDPVDLRDLDDRPLGPLESGLISIVFSNLNNTRQRARQTIGILGDYLPEEPALRAHLYAVQGYAEVMLAELFCSGIPLSTVDYKGNYTLRPGSRTQEVFAHAVALFDTADKLIEATDSTRILNLIRVGRARALLDSGDDAAAAAAAAAVSDSFRYAMRYAPSSTGQNTVGFGFLGGLNIWKTTTVSDLEGTNGLPYRSSNDPRTRTTDVGNQHYHPDKYPVNGQDTIVLASGIEARLIEAEAALRANPDDGQWLAKLNALRTDGSEPRPTDDPNDGDATYTYWRAGSGGVDSLPLLADPGASLSDPVAAKDARVDLLFRERAFWLFLTGHRQGDMRRLVRRYDRAQADVYPVGTGTYGGTYERFIDMPIPWEERELNPLFTGCLSRD